jgi:hypothetical protein
MIPFAGVEIPDLGNYFPDPVQQFFELLALGSFRLMNRFLTAAFTSAFNKRFTVQTEPTDVERPSVGERSQRAVLILDKMGSKVISKRMEDSFRRVRSSIIAFELVAGMTAINPIF